MSSLFAQGAVVAVATATGSGSAVASQVALILYQTVFGKFLMTLALVAWITAETLRYKSRQAQCLAFERALTANAPRPFFYERATDEPPPLPRVQHCVPEKRRQRRLQLAPPASF